MRSAAFSEYLAILALRLTRVAAISFPEGLSPSKSKVMLGTQRKRGRSPRQPKLARLVHAMLARTCTREWSQAGPVTC